MKLKLVLFFVVLAFARAEQELEDEDEPECGEEKATDCLANLIVVALSDPSEEEVCIIVRETSQCLEEVADECFGDDRDPELEEGLQELRKLVKDSCPRSLSDVPDDTVECLKGLEEEAMECVGDSVAEALEMVQQASSEQELDENEIKCSMYKSISVCILNKVENACGEEAGRLALEALMDVPDEITEICKTPITTESVKGLMYDIVKRRRK